MTATARILAAGAGLTIAALALSGCASNSANADLHGNDNTASATPVDVSGTLTIYTSEPQDKATQIIAAFNQEYPNVTVSLFRGGTGDVTARIAAEQKAGGVKADIVWAADAGTFNGFEKQGLLQKYRPANASALDKSYIDPNGYYVGTRIIPTVIAYNTTKIKTPPKSWADLADPKYKDKITLPDPAVSGAAAYNAAAWYGVDSLGTSWFSALGANKAVVAASNGPVSQAVASGAQPIGIVVDYLVRDLQKAGSPVAVAYPSEGVPYIDEPMGVFKDSTNKAAAEAFENFIVSKAGQKLAVQQDYLPVRTDVGAPAGAPSLSHLKTLAPSQATIDANEPKAVSAFKAAVGG